MKKHTKKTVIPIALLIVLVLLIALVSYVGIFGSEKPQTLSELQVIACNTANEAGTCNTRLAEVGIVLKEECCQALGKCC